MTQTRLYRGKCKEPFRIKYKECTNTTVIVRMIKTNIFPLNIRDYNLLLNTDLAFEKPCNLKTMMLETMYRESIRLKKNGNNIRNDSL